MFTYYILIAGISIVSLAIIPMLQSTIDASFKFPQTTAAWMLWIGSRICITILNLLIFHCFICQADLNTQENESRKEAEGILGQIKKSKELIPQSKEQFLSGEYKHKIPTLILSTVVSLIAFGPAVLTFDLVTFLTYLFTVIVAIVFGIIEMLKVESYYKTELIRYAKWLKETEECLQSYYSQQLSSHSQNVVIDCKYLGNSSKKVTAVSSINKDRDHANKRK